MALGYLTVGIAEVTTQLTAPAVAEWVGGAVVVVAGLGVLLGRTGTHPVEDESTSS